MKAVLNAIRRPQLLLWMLALVSMPVRLGAWQFDPKNVSAMLTLSAALRTAAGGADYAADVEMVTTETNGPVTQYFTCMAKGGKLRIDFDLGAAAQAAAKVGEVGASEAASLIKQMGMDRIGVFHEQGQPNFSVVFPGLRAAMTETIPPGVQAELEHLSSPKAAPKPGVTETIDGTEYSRTTLRLRDGTTDIVWLQKDRNNFPALFESRKRGQPIVIRVVALEKSEPDDARLSVPAGIRTYDSFQEIQGLARQRVMNLMRPGGSPRPR